MHTDIIHACLHYQSRSDYTESVIRNEIQECYQSSIFQVAGPTKAAFTSIFSFPQYFPQFSHYLSKGNW